MKGQLTMPERPTYADRLAQLMDSRRLELGLKWTEVAERAGAGVSAETLRAIRRGEQTPRPLTRAAIDRALQWAPGSTDRIISEPEGPDPLPASTPPIPSPITIADLPDPASDEDQRLVELLLTRGGTLSALDREMLDDIMRMTDRDGNPRPWPYRRDMMLALLLNRDPADMDAQRPGESA
jgi:hypothetical protein